MVAVKHKRFLLFTLFTLISIARCPRRKQFACVRAHTRTHPEKWLHVFKVNLDAVTGTYVQYVSRLKFTPSTD